MSLLPIYSAIFSNSLSLYNKTCHFNISSAQNSTSHVRCSINTFLFKILENAYSKGAFASCPGQFRARAGNESSVSTTPLGVRHESKTVSVLARQKHGEHVITQQKFTQFHSDFLIMNKTSPRLPFRVFQVHKMSDFSLSFRSFKSHVSCLESQPCGFDFFFL